MELTPAEQRAVALARRAGVNQGFLSEIERGKRKPSPSSLQALAVARCLAADAGKVTVLAAGPSAAGAAQAFVARGADAVLTADRTFQTAVKEAYKATKVFEYYTSQSYAALEKLFLIRNCRDTFFRNRTRPCLQYQIRRCTAPCVGLVDEAAYAEHIAERRGRIGSVPERVDFVEIESDDRLHATGRDVDPDHLVVEAVEPQQRTAPSSSTAQLWFPPASICVATYSGTPLGVG